MREKKYLIRVGEVSNRERRIRKTADLFGTVCRDAIRNATCVPDPEGKGIIVRTNSYLSINARDKICEAWAKRKPHELLSVRFLYSEGDRRDLQQSRELEAVEQGPKEYFARVGVVRNREKRMEDLGEGLSYLANELYPGLDSKWDLELFGKGVLLCSPRPLSHDERYRLTAAWRHQFKQGSLSVGALRPYTEDSL